MVLEALKALPFEPLDSVDLKYLTLKTVFLIALSSVKLVGDLHALSVSPTCLEFGPNDSKVILKPRHGYIPKAIGTPFRAQIISLSALPASDGEDSDSLLCPVRALRAYITRSAAFRRSEQLFVSFGGRTKGLAASKHSLSRWIVDAIAAAYASKHLQCPMGIRAHSTRGMASSWAWSGGISIHDICMAAGWASPSTFVRFYNLEVIFSIHRPAEPLCIPMKCLLHVLARVAGRLFPTCFVFPGSPWDSCSGCSARTALTRGSRSVSNLRNTREPLVRERTRLLT